MKSNYLIFFVFVLFTVFITACNETEDDEFLGDWWEVSGLDGVSRSDAVGFVIDSKFYLTTGYDGDDQLKDLWVYDPELDSWTRKADFPGVARNRAVGIAINGKGYVGTGFDGDDALDDFYEYDPVKDEWKQIASFPGGSRYYSCAFAIDDLGYVGMGIDDDNQMYKDFYAYSPETNSWSGIISPGAAKRIGAQTFVIDGIGYVISGYTNGYEDDMWAYNPINGAWTEMRKISNATDYDYDDDYSYIPRVNGTAFSINGKGYMAIGSVGTILNTVWEYDPILDEWQQKTEFAEGEASSRTEAVGFAIGSKGYVATGRSGSSYFYDVWGFDPNAEADDENN